MGRAGRCIRVLVERGVVVPRLFHYSSSSFCERMSRVEGQRKSSADLCDDIISEANELSRLSAPAMPPSEADADEDEDDVQFGPAPSLHPPTAKVANGMNSLCP